MARKLRWTDVRDIAIELEERHPDIDNVNLRFTDLHRWVMELPVFEDDPNRSNEKILEAIQAAFRAAAATGALAPYLEVLDAELVSADLVGQTASCLYDPFLTKLLAPRLVKVFGWHDNELAAAARLTDLCLRVLEVAP